MALSDIVFSVLLLAVVGFQIWLTRKVWRSSMFDRGQKMNQARVIWLLPVLGAALVYALMPPDDDDREKPTLSA
ncbi:MAG: hypothetical protein R3B13_34800 [Polyangiaceae bacterium]